MQALSAALGAAAWLGQLRLHHQAPRARVDDAERAQSKQGKHLNARARLAGLGGDGRGAGADQTLDHRAEERRRRQRGILGGQAAGIESPPDEFFKFGGKRVTVAEARAVNLGLDRFADERKGKPPLHKRAGRKRGDRGR